MPPRFCKLVSFLIVVLKIISSYVYLSFGGGEWEKKLKYIWVGFDIPDETADVFKMFLAVFS